MIIFITYSDETYSVSREYCIKMALKKGKVDKAIAYRPEDIDRGFKEAHKDILGIKRGNGLWLWKPYFLYKTLNEDASDGDIVLYSDGGAFFYRSCKPIIASMKNQDVWVSNIPLIEKQYTKPELFETMQCTGYQYTDTNQVQGGFVAIKKTNQGLEFVKEWLELCCSYDNISSETASPASNNEFSSIFVSHRHDQSILSLLIKKRKIMPHLDPTQYGRMPFKYYSTGRLYEVPDNCGEYAPCIILHRGKKPEFKTCFYQWLCCWLPMTILKRITKGYQLYKQDQKISVR